MYVTIIAEGLLILTYGHRVMRVLKRATPTLTRFIRHRGERSTTKPLIPIELLQVYNFVLKTEHYP
mgnify:CR=1 FL=1